MCRISVSYISSSILPHGSISLSSYPLHHDGATQPNSLLEQISVVQPQSSMSPRGNETADAPLRDAHNSKNIDEDQALREVLDSLSKMQNAATAPAMAEPANYSTSYGVSCHEYHHHGVNSLEEKEAPPTSWSFAARQRTECARLTRAFRWARQRIRQQLRGLALDQSERLLKTVRRIKGGCVFSPSFFLSIAHGT